MLESILFFLVLIIGIFSSYTDIRYYKIRNYSNYFFIILIISIYTYLYFYNFYDLNFLVTIYSDLFYVFLVSVIFWYLDIWGGGDSKLYISLSLLTPFIIYNSYSLPFYSVSILSNSILLFIFFQFILLFKNKFSSKNKINQIKNFDYSLFFGIKNLYLLLFIFCLQIIFIYLKIILNPLYNFFLIFSIIMVIQLSFSKFDIKFPIFVNYIILVLFSIIILSFLFYYSKQYFFIFLLFKTIFIYFIFIFIFIFLPNNFFVKNINLTELKLGLVLFEDLFIDKSNKLYYNNQINFNSNIYNLFIKKNLKGLNKNEIIKLKKIIKKNNVDFEIKILETTHFAIYLFIGTILIHLLKIDLLTFFLNFF